MLIPNLKSAIHNRRLLWLLLVNLALLLLYPWTVSETTHIQVKVTGSSLAATVNGVTAVLDDSTNAAAIRPADVIPVGHAALPASSPTFASGRVGLYISGWEAAFSYIPPGYDKATGLPRATWMRRLVEWVAQTNPGPAWLRLVVRDAHSGQVLLQSGPQGWGDWSALAGDWRFTGWQDLAPSGEGLILSNAGADWRDLEIEADLRRAGRPVALLVRAQPNGDGYWLWLRGEHNDMIWLRQRDGELEEPATYGVSFRKPLSHRVQDLLRELLKTQQFALMLVIGYWVLSISGFWIADCGFQILHRKAGVWAERISQSLLSNIHFIAMVALLTLALTLALYVAVDILEAIPHVQDDVSYLFQAKVLASGRIKAPAPALPEFFEHEFVIIQGGEWFSRYPPGYPALLALGVKLGAPWLVNPLLATLSLGLIYLAARQTAGKWPALLALLLGATSPFWLFLAGSYMAHPATLFWLSLFIYAFIRVYSRSTFPVSEATFHPIHPQSLAISHWAWGLMGGFAWGMAFSTRELTALGIGIPVGLWAMLDDGWRTSSQAKNAQSSPLHPSSFIPHPIFFILRKYLPFVLGALLPLAGFFWYNAQLTGDPWLMPFHLDRPWDRIGFGVGIGARGFHDLAEALWNLQRNLQEMMARLYGWPAYLTLAPAMLLFLLGRGRRWDLFWLLLLLGQVVAYLFYWADAVMFGPRYYYETLPSLLILSARGFEELSRLGNWQISALRDWVLGMRRWRSANWQTRHSPLPVGGKSTISDSQSPIANLQSKIVLALILACLIGYTLGEHLPAELEGHRGYNYVSGASLQAVKAADIHNAVVFVVSQPSWYWWLYGAVFPANSPDLDTDVIYARDRGPANVLLMNHYPDRSYYRLDKTGLTPLTR